MKIEDGSPLSSNDVLLDRMKAARRGPAVLKYRLLYLRSISPKIAVLAFEGGDDKIVYSRWINRIRPALEYEAFPCGTKRGVLELRDVISRDLGGIGAGVFFFIDRDFDPETDVYEDEAVFITDNYSIDNYLVNEVVLRNLLMNEFHCHARPDVRGPIVELFLSDYQEFLNISREINWRLFAAKRLGFMMPSAPDKVTAFAIVKIGEMTASDVSVDQIFPLPHNVVAEELNNLKAEFDELDPPTRYRGRYNREFFERWLNLLADDYACDNPVHFADIDRKEKVRRSELVLGGLASWSPLPDGLADFLDAIARA